MISSVWNTSLKILLIFYVSSCLKVLRLKKLWIFMFSLVCNPRLQSLWNFYVSTCMKSMSVETLNIFEKIPFRIFSSKILNTLETCLEYQRTLNIFENLCLESRSEEALVDFWTLVRLLDYIYLFRPLSGSRSLSIILDPCPSPYFGGVVRVLRGGGLL